MGIEQEFEGKYKVINEWMKIQEGETKNKSETVTSCSLARQWQYC